MTRKYTKELLSQVKAGVIDPEALAKDLLGYLSEPEVEDFCDCYGYEFFEEEEEEEE